MFRCKVETRAAHHAKRVYQRMVVMRIEIIQNQVDVFCIAADRPLGGALVLPIKPSKVTGKTEYTLRKECKTHRPQTTNQQAGHSLGSIVSRFGGVLLEGHSICELIDLFVLQR